MKEKFIIIAIAILIVLGFSYLIFNFKTNLSGFAVNIDQPKLDINKSLDEANATKQDVVKAIEEAKLTIEEMRLNNFSVLYVNDELIEAQRILKQAEYVEIIKNESANQQEKLEAQKALQLVDPKEISYDAAINHINNIKARKQRAFVIYDSIGVIKISLSGSKERGINVTNSEKLLEEVELAFYEDRYNDAEKLLESVKEELKLQTFSFSIIKAIRRGIQTFIEKYWKKYWYIIIIILTLISIIMFFVYRKVIEIMLKREIKKMKNKKEIIISLIKKTQEERFKKESISGLVYNIRIKKYQEKLTKINEKLPMLEEKLKSMYIPIGYLKANTTSI